MSDLTESGLLANATKLFGGYPHAEGVYDEVAATPGIPREHWRTFIRAFEQLGRDELALRWENARRMIREHGVTYNVYGDPQGMARPWELDMLPLLMSAAEWKQLEAGLIQRARLFNLILADLYGRQRLLRDGFLPPGLVLGNPSFLRPCHGLLAADDIYLHLHGADLARSPDGQWWVVADRTQAPSGAGYALENRMVLSQILPDEFRECRVQRLASFFSMQRETLRQLAPSRTDNPNIVLLTPGPHNETYFEHAYLARYLGFPLVEGADLTVRDQSVFIKTLEGLQRVDVLLRRVDDTFCDPLELRGESFLGVPGLVEAVRSGNVAVANSLGSGLVQSPAFMAFLPSLCRRLLDEELKLPSVATWWCGQGTEQRYVLENLDKIVVKRAFGSVGQSAFFGEKLSRKKRAKLITVLQARPQEFVGQEQVVLSRAPVWLENRAEPRPIILRAYTVAGAESYSVMPGGLTRVSVSTEEPVISMQSGGGSKDAWVLLDGPTPAAQHVVSLISSHADRAAAELPSRVADNLFWLGRYVERLEGTVRLLRTIIVRMGGESSGEGSPELAALAQVSCDLELLPSRFRGRIPFDEMAREILSLIYHQRRIGSIRELLGRVRQIASTVRDRFSADTWRILNQLQSNSRTRPGRIPIANGLSLLNALVVDLGAFSGMEMENMTRGQGWRFLDFGRRLERASNLLTLLRAALAPDVDIGAILEPLLEVADSVMTYRRRYFARLEFVPVSNLLLLDESNPRSVAFQVKALAEHAAKLPGGFRAGKDDRISELSAKLAQLDLRTRAEARIQGQSQEIQEWLTAFLGELTSLSEDLTHSYFTHTISRLS